MASTTLQVLYRRLASLVGEYTSTTTSAVAVGPDPSRWLISAEIRRDDGSPRFDGHFAYISAIGSTRIIRDLPARGAVATHVPIATHILGTAFDLTWPMPLYTFQGVTGLQTMIAEAGWNVWHEDRVDITTVAGQYEYDLSAQAAWLDSEDRVLGLDDPSIGGMASEAADWRYGGLTLDGGTPTLRLRRAYLGSGGTFQLRVMRPASSLVNGSESTVGPSAVTDTVKADPTELVNVALLRAYRYLANANHIGADERARYAALVAPQEAWVRANVRHYLPRDEMPQAAAKAVA